MKITELRHVEYDFIFPKGEQSLGEKGFKELVKGLAKSTGSLQVLDMRYLGIQQNHVSKLAESHLTSEGLTYVRIKKNDLLVISFHTYYCTVAPA